jgi:hypothetical protein
MVASSVTRVRRAARPDPGAQLYDDRVRSGGQEVGVTQFVDDLVGHPENLKVDDAAPVASTGKPLLTRSATDAAE